MSHGEDPRTDEPTAIADQLRKVTKVLEEGGVEHWLDCGTLLGIVRDRRPLPGDKDIDLGIWEQDLASLQALAPRFKEIGYKMNGLQYGQWTYGVNVRSLDRQGVVVSFGIYGRHGDHAWRMASYLAPNPHPPWTPMFFVRGVFRYPVRKMIRKRRGRTDIARLCRTWPYSRILNVATWWIPIHLLDPVRRMADSGFLGPADPEGLLEAHYGEWRKPVSDYIWWRDDLLVKHKAPEEIMADHPVPRDSTTQPLTEK